MCDDVSKTFGITLERVECKFSYNPPVNKTKITTGSDFWSDRVYVMRVCASGRDWKKIRKSITTSSAKYNFVTSGDGVTAVTLLLSRIHNKLISRLASHENIRKVLGICIRNQRDGLLMTWEEWEGAESGKTSTKIKRTTLQCRSTDIENFMIISRRVTQKFLAEDLSSLKQNSKQIDLYTPSLGFIICIYLYLYIKGICTEPTLYLWTDHLLIVCR